MIGLNCGVDFTNRATELTDSQSIYVWVDWDTFGLQWIWYFIGKMDPCRWGTTVELLWLIPIRDARVWEGVCCPHWFPLAPWVSIFWNLWISQHTLWHAPGDGNINLQEFSKLVEPLGQIWLGMCLTKWLPLRSTGSAEVSETEILDGSTGVGIFWFTKPLWVPGSLPAQRGEGWVAHTGKVLNLTLDPAKLT